MTREQRKLLKIANEGAEAPIRIVIGGAAMRLYAGDQEVTRGCARVSEYLRQLTGRHDLVSKQDRYKFSRLK